MEDLKYYAVKAKCGHVGKGKYIEITFPVKAKSRKDAAIKTKTFPRVKRDNPYAIIFVDKISYEEYQGLLNENDKNPYLQCKNIQEQNRNCPLIYDEIKDLYDEVNYKDDRKTRLSYLFKKRKEVNKINSKYYYESCNNEIYA